MEKVRNYKDIFEEHENFWNQMFVDYLNPNKLCIVEIFFID